MAGKLRKRCARCNQMLLFAEFSSHRAHADGLMSSCRACTNKDKRERYANDPAHRERILAWCRKESEKPERRAKDIARVAAWAKKNPDLHKAAVRKWQQKNKERACAASKRWGAANPEKRKAMVREWIAKNREHVNSYNSARHHRVRHLTPPDADMNAIRAMYREAQRLTKETGVRYSVDHIIPIAKGGLHHQDNLQIITLSENCSKQHRR